MAVMYPPRFPYLNDRMRNAENRFFSACSTQLDDSWTVLYEVKFHGPRKNGKNERGDADFVLLNAKKGIFVVEVKGGEVIYIKDNKWFTKPHGKSADEAKAIKNPFDQAADAKSILIRYLKDKLPGLPIIGGVGHIVVFPGHSQVGDMSPAAKRQLICDKDDLLQLDAKLNKVVDYFRQSHKFESEDITLIRDALFPTFRLNGSRHLEFLKTKDDLDHLTDMQLLAYAMNRSQRQLVTSGGPGTGKTVLAFHRAKELASQNLKTLYICNSEGLRASLEGKVLESDDVQLPLTITTTYGLIETVISSNNTDLNCEVDYSKFTEVESNFVDAIRDDLKYDACVVDEAQSISAHHMELISLLLSDDGYLYVFGDSSQRLLLHGHVTSALQSYSSLPRIELNMNCRSTKEIVKTIPGQIECFSTSGPSPEWILAEESEILEESLLQAADLTKTFGIPSTDISIVTTYLGRRHFLEIQQTEFQIFDIDYFQGLESKAVVCAISRGLLRETTSYWGVRRWLKNLIGKEGLTGEEFENDFAKVESEFENYCNEQYRDIRVNEKEKVMARNFDYKKGQMPLELFSAVSDFEPVFSNRLLANIYRNYVNAAVLRNLYSIMSRASIILVVVATDEIRAIYADDIKKHSKT